MYLLITGSSIISGAEYVLKDYLENSSLQSQFIILASEAFKNQNFYNETLFRRCYYSSLFGHAGAISTRHPAAWIKKGLRYIRSKRVINEIFDDNRIFVAIGNNAGDIIYSRIVKNIEDNIKFILYVHEIIDRKTMLGKVLRFFDRYVDLYIAVSNAVKTKLCENDIDAAKIKIVYNGLKYTKRKKSEKIHLDSFGYIGNIAENKKPLSFIEFLQQLEWFSKSRFRGYMAFKHAEPGLLQQITEEIVKYNLDIQLAGEVKREEMQSFYQKIGYLFVPFVNDSFPTVILEAFNNGIPVIGRRSGGIPELIEHGYNGFLFTNENDFIMLAELLSKTDAVAYRILSENANTTIQKRFDIKDKCKKLDSLLLSMKDQATQQYV